MQVELAYNPVVTSVQEILEAAMQLPEDERACIVTVLQDSLGDGTTQAEVDAAVLAEVRRRLERYERGETVAIPFEQVQAKLDAFIERAQQQLASGR